MKLHSNPLTEALKTFPYYYIGGGYFRQAGIPVGKTAQIFHGSGILPVFFEHVTKILESQHVNLNNQSTTPELPRNQTSG